MSRATRWPRDYADTPENGPGQTLARTWKTSTTVWSSSNPYSIAFPTGVPICRAPARTTGPSRSVGTIEPDARSAVPNSSRPSSNKPAKPGIQTLRPQTILNQLGILSPELPVPGIASPAPGMADLFQKFRHYCVELLRILQVHYMSCIRGYKQL
jgi:hypothetical protein